jgi:hypothetical protein
MQLNKKTLEFSIQKTVTEEQFITTEFITDNEQPFTLVSYRKPIRLPRYEKTSQLEWCDVIKNHVLKVRRRQIEKGVYEDVTEYADIFDYMYYGSKYKTTKDVVHKCKFNDIVTKQTVMPENLTRIVNTFRNKMLEEKCLDKPKKFSITKKGYDVKIGCRNSTDFNTYTLNLVIKLTY